VEREEVLEALSGHMCRCTGYVKIVDAVMAASRGEVEVATLDEMLVPDAAEPEVEIRGSAA
jgi:xanthine dehydrogenase iron-sulfur cluster and FAD-binding subunit A